MEIFYFTKRNYAITRLLFQGTTRKVVAQILWPAPEAAVTVLCTPDDGCDRHPKHVQ